ncbi:MAG: hypothetical protein EXR75_02110, partial [Myxococcales bacterium]|nr:hypothetical protein [Myxococcales bacterium]
MRRPASSPAPSHASSHAPSHAQKSSRTIFACAVLLTTACDSGGPRVLDAEPFPSTPSSAVVATRDAALETEPVPVHERIVFSQTYAIDKL